MRPSDTMGLRLVARFGRAATEGVVAVLVLGDAGCVGRVGHVDGWRRPGPGRRRRPGAVEPDLLLHARHGDDFRIDALLLGESRRASSTTKAPILLSSAREAMRSLRSSSRSWSTTPASPTLTISLASSASFAPISIHRPFMSETFLRSSGSMR